MEEIDHTGAGHRGEDEQEAYESAQGDMLDSGDQDAEPPASAEPGEHDVQPDQAEG